MPRLSILSWLLLSLALAPVLPGAEYVPAPLSVDDHRQMLAADTWAKGRVSLKDGSSERGYLALQGDTLTVKTSPSRRVGTELALPAIASIELTKDGGRLVSKALSAIEQHAYAEALQLLSDYRQEQQQAGEPVEAYARGLEILASRGQQEVGRLLAAIESAPNPAAFLHAFEAWRKAFDRDRKMPEQLTKIVAGAWGRWVAGMPSEQRQSWQDLFKNFGLRLDWDEATPQRLLSGRAAAKAGDHATAANDLRAAIDGHAAFTDDDLLLLAESFLQTQQPDLAQVYLLRLPAKVQQAPRSRTLLERAGLVAPPLTPTLLVQAYIGGAGDQRFSRIETQTDGSFTISSHDGTLALNFDAQGNLRQKSGDPNAVHDDEGKRPYAVKKEVTNPHDGSTWSFGYKQVHSILQQPYLISPHGWHWWDWKHSDAQPRQLMADSRTIDLLFPTPETFAVWAWADGGNSTIDRDPRKLEAKNDATRGYYGGGSKIMLGEQSTGKAIRGYNWFGRPDDWCLDIFGNIYVAGLPREPGNLKDLLAGPEDADGIAIYDRDLQPLGKIRLPLMEIRRLQVIGKLLVAAGEVGRDAGTDKRGKSFEKIDANQMPTVRPLQPTWGGGADAAVAIIQLW